MVYSSESEKETQKIAGEFASSLKGGDVICLYGDLGAGKTTFTQGLARGLGITQRVISPTFILIREHPLKNGLKFYHIDLYRLEKIDQIEDVGLKEILEDRNAITIIEWAERLGTFLPKKRIDIRLVQKSDSRREIVIEKYE